MNYKLEQKRKGVIVKRLPLITEINQELIDLLEQCELLEFAPTEVKEKCELIISTYANDERKRSIYFIAQRLLKLDKYKFELMGGATGEFKIVYALSHADAWKKVSNYIIEDWQGNIKSAFCISVNDKDIGTLRSLNSLFTPVIEGEINSIKADNMLAGWEKYN